MRSRNRKCFEAHGELFFITSTVVGFIKIFNYKRPCDIFVDCLRFYIERGDFVLIAWVLMPEHFHLIVKMKKSKDISKVIGGIKRYTARQIGELRTVSELKQVLDQIKLAAAGEPGKGTAIWKPRFDSFVITSENAFRQKIEYIHNNPVRKGLVAEPWQWWYSSASAYTGKTGIDLPIDCNWHSIGYGEMPSGKDS